MQLLHIISSGEKIGNNENEAEKLRHYRNKVLRKNHDNITDYLCMYTVNE